MRNSFVAAALCANRQHAPGLRHRARDQAIATVFRPFVFGAGDANEVITAALDVKFKVRIFVDIVVVVEIQLIAAFIQEPQRAIEWRTGPPRQQIEYQKLAAFRVKAEDIVIGFIYDAVDNCGKGDLLGVC